LIGSRGRGTLTAEQLATLEDGAFEADTELEGGDVLMEVLAEDNRRAHHVEFVDEDLFRAVTEDAGRGRTGAGLAHHFPTEDSKGEKYLPPPKGPRAAQRRYLTHEGVGPGTVYERARSAATARLERAEEGAFSYRLPEGAHQAREAARRSRARMRDHDIVESRIEEAIAAGAFENLPGAGKPLKDDSNAFELISGEAMAHRILKNAGCAPQWVEQGKEIRTGAQAARAAYAVQLAEILIARGGARSALLDTGGGHASVLGGGSLLRGAAGEAGRQAAVATGGGNQNPGPRAPTVGSAAAGAAGAAEGATGGGGVNDDFTPADVAADVACAAAALARESVAARAPDGGLRLVAPAAPARSWTTLRLDDRDSGGVQVVGVHCPGMAGIRMAASQEADQASKAGRSEAGVGSATAAGNAPVRWPTEIWEAMGPHGTSPLGTSPHGMRPHGMRPHGMGPGGTSSHGMKSGKMRPGGPSRAVGVTLGAAEAEAAVRCAEEAAEAAAAAAQCRDAVAAKEAANRAVDAALCACAGRPGVLEDASASFAERIGVLNRKIRSYNLVVPSATSQLLALKLEVEKGKAISDVCARAVEMRRSAASREAMRVAAVGTGSDELHVLGMPGSLSGGWAQAEPVRHGILASLASVLW
jgi:DnaJ family protein C protein 28